MIFLCVIISLFLLISFYSHKILTVKMTSSLKKNKKMIFFLGGSLMHSF
uniref:ATP synthase F0 subunit 8 n=1 Tax=Galba pervia TaxID=1051332 RepID=J3RFA5_9GAST|nr:ATP synthase F0 subunit 8 [Galba pervia]AEO51217.1 ATP synthase F0 subunit 8 [Galba pervia]